MNGLLTRLVSTTVLRAAEALRRAADVLDPSEVDEQHAYEAGYRTAAHEIETDVANYTYAKERGLYRGNQDLRIAWDRGYDAAVCAYRLGHDPAELVRAELYTESLVTLIAVVEDVEAGKTLRPDPRRRS